METDGYDEDFVGDADDLAYVPLLSSFLLRSSPRLSSP